MPFSMVGKIFTTMFSPLFVIVRSCLWLLLGYKMLPYVDYAFAVLYVYHRLNEVCSNSDSFRESVYQMVMLFFPKNIYNVFLQNSFRRERNNLIKKIGIK